LLGLTIAIKQQNEQKKSIKYFLWIWNNEAVKWIILTWNKKCLRKWEGWCGERLVKNGICWVHTCSAVVGSELLTDSNHLNSTPKGRTHQG
jgi:hypothetical protein